jgi:hypothetical protein
VDFKTVRPEENIDVFTTSSMGVIELNNLPLTKDKIAPLKPSKKESETNENKIRLCAACGNPLAAEQKNSSKYCSAKYVGEKGAKKCRNKISNEAHNSKRSKELKNAKISKLKKTENFLFDQSPFIRLKDARQGNTLGGREKQRI